MKNEALRNIRTMRQTEAALTSPGAGGPGQPGLRVRDEIHVPGKRVQGWANREDSVRSPGLQRGLLLLEEPHPGPRNRGRELSRPIGESDSAKRPGEPGIDPAISGNRPALKAASFERADCPSGLLTLRLNPLEIRQAKCLWKGGICNDGCPAGKARDL